MLRTPHILIEQHSGSIIGDRSYAGLYRQPHEEGITSMKKVGVAILVACAVSAPALADTNVALNAPVTVSGTGFGNWSATWGSGALGSLASVTDGAFLPNGQQWNVGTVFWNGTGGGDLNNFVFITMGATATVTSLTLQADNNDDYLIQFWNAANNWQDLVTISPSRSWNMTMGSATLAAPVTTSAFRIRSSGGDGYYSVSEFQANGSIAAVPEPETYAMLLAGLGLLGSMARRKKSA
jgi:hypothetical protein